MPRLRQDPRELLLRLLRALQGCAARDRLSRRSVPGTTHRRRLALQLAAGARAEGRAARSPGLPISRASRPPSASRTSIIAFNGYWPEKGALLETCTFKEFEAAVVLQNARENGVEGLIVASAGNTARAFAHLSAITGFPVVIVVPRMCLMEMWYLEPSSVVQTFAVGDGDYSDSIDVAKRIAMTAGFPVRRRGQEHREARRARHRDARSGLEDRAGCRTITSRPWAAARARSAAGRWRSAS